MKKSFFIIFGLIIFSVTTYGQLTLKEVKFAGWFGHNTNGGDQTTYSLLGTGFFRTPRAENTDSIISVWFNKHPEALVIPIYSSGPTMVDRPDSRMTYSWVVDNSDTLNIMLVKYGCVSGGTMQRPQTWDEMSEKQRRLWHNNQKPDEQVHVDGKTYSAFLDKVLKAEQIAKEKKLGIWIEKKE